MLLLGAGIAASSRRGSTSKGTKVSNLYKYLNNFFNNFGNFLVSHVFNSNWLHHVFVD